MYHVDLLRGYKPEIMNGTREKRNADEGVEGARTEGAYFAGWLPSKLLNTTAQSALEYMQVLSQNLCIIPSTKENFSARCLPNVCAGENNISPERSTTKIIGRHARPRELRNTST
ncbi:hypothetical protein WN48_03512 [Eufriesea mexicana]|uniref:Uncharacterized protein n=1 Tax=Eufriesea mexicana TaxID=516756 RepID=A0A310SKB2_9HYME|nr:hypothetical protein WN48_03512 [Eufriesea mexicana]